MRIRATSVQSYFTPILARPTAGVTFAVFSQLQKGEGTARAAIGRHG